jgi:hypothetical protein
MSKFSKRVFIIYILTFIVIWSLSKTLWLVILFSIMFLQFINVLLKKFLNRYTWYNESKLFNESEQLRFVYAYFGFPVVLFFPKYFRELRKVSYHERTLKQTEEMIEMYNKNQIPIDERLKEMWVDCNRFLKLKKIRTKQRELHDKQ